MHNKRYILEKIEEFGRHNFVYDGAEGCIAYPAYFNVGERGWFLYVEDHPTERFAHRIHTSVVKSVEYFENLTNEKDYIVVETENTRLKFRLI